MNKHFHNHKQLRPIKFISKGTQAELKTKYLILNRCKCTELSMLSQCVVFVTQSIDPGGPD